MPEWKDYRAESRKNYGERREGGLCLDQLKVGALLRIADATEQIAKRYQALLDERDYYKRRLEDSEKALTKRYRQNTALRAVITRLKNAKHRNGK